MRNPQDKLRLRDRVRAEWNHVINWILKPTGYRRTATCSLCGREGFSMDPQDSGNLWEHFEEYHPWMLD